MCSNKDKFQFHNGSIKSVVVIVIANRLNKFQFHNGSIKRKKWQAWITMRLPFQFHNGSIKRGRAADDNNKKRSVSIPQWFD